MDIKQWFLVASVVLAVILYYFIIKGVIVDKSEHSVATWIMWGALDGIVLITNWLQGGSYGILILYCSGSTITVCTLIYMKQFKWTWVETLSAFLVIVCLCIWYKSEPRQATIWTTIAVCIASVPLMYDFWEKPDPVAARIYFGYVFVNALACIAAKAWTIEDRFYTALMVPLCLTIAYIANRKTVAETDAVLRPQASHHHRIWDIWVR